MTDFKPISDEVCAACGKPIDVQPGETFTASTDGKVWHYGCSPSRQPAASDRDVLVAENARLREALNIFTRAAYPVAAEINERGYNWSEAYLDEALPIARAALVPLGGGVTTLDTPRESST